MDVAINVVLAVGSFVVWLSMVRGRGSDRNLALGGLQSLKYYTVLSNLFSGIASALYMAAALTGGATASQIAPKVASAATVTITFLVTALLLAPSMGWGAMYAGPNFWLHLVFPVLAVADVCLFVPVRLMPFWMTALAGLATAFYAAWYVGRIRRFGPERDGVVYDFYGFCRWGEDKVPLVAAGMIALTWAIAAVMWAVG